MTNLSVIADV